MKKVLFILAGLLLVPAIAFAGQSVKSEPATSSGLKTSSVAITTKPTTVYGVTGYATNGAAQYTIHLVDGAVSDSETAGSQLVSDTDIGDSSIDIDIPAVGISFPTSLYLNNTNASVQVHYTTP